MERKRRILKRDPQIEMNMNRPKVTDSNRQIYIYIYIYIYIAEIGMRWDVCV